MGKLKRRNITGWRCTGDRDKVGMKIHVLLNSLRQKRAHLLVLDIVATIQIVVIRQSPQMRMLVGHYENAKSEQEIDGGGERERKNFAPSPQLSHKRHRQWMRSD